MKENVGEMYFGTSKYYGVERGVKDIEAVFILVFFRWGHFQ